MRVGAPSRRADTGTSAGYFNGDFENGSYTQYDTIAYHVGNAVADQFVTVTSNPAPRTGTYCGRFTVRPGDWITSVGQEECMVRGGGAKLPEETEGDDFYYAWSTQFPSDWQMPTGWGNIIEWHSNFPVTAPVQISNRTTDALWLSLNTSDLVNHVGASFSQTYQFLSTLSLGQWNDFIMRVRWRYANTGIVQVWHRVGSGNFTKKLELTGVSTLQRDNGSTSNNWLTMGLYRNANDFTSVIYHDGFHRSTMLRDVTSAFPATSFVVPS